MLIALVTNPFAMRLFIFALSNACQLCNKLLCA